MSGDLVNKRVLITGASGFIGKAVTAHFLQKGCHVYAMVRKLQTIDFHNMKSERLHIFECDMNNIEQLPHLIQAKQIEICLHFAWNGSAGLNRGVYSIQIQNISETCQLLEACSKLRCKRFIYAASLMEYECIKTMNDRIVPPTSNIYSAAKLSADYMAKALAGKLGLDYFSAVISNAYGPGEKSARLINMILHKLARKEEVLLTEGSQLYDFIYIGDVAEAFYQIATGGRPQQVYYIGSGQPKPLKLFMIQLGEVASGLHLLKFGEIPFKGVALSYEEFDMEALKRDTGFVPEVPFERGIALTYNLIKNKPQCGI